jgi:Cellulase (glycosyl hydrolase family 5)
MFLHRPGKNSKIIAFLAICVLCTVLVLLLFFSQHQQPTREHKAGTPPTCNHSGVTKNPDGTYTFARLHVDTNGILVDSTECEVYLLGVQGRHARPIGPNDDYTITNADFSYITQSKQAVPSTNMLRITFNAADWVNNTFVPGANMYYQDFLKAHIKAIEANGDYVQLDKDSFVSTEAQFIEALTDIAKYYTNDPAIIFDVRNEGLNPHEINALDHDNSYLNAVDAGNPNAVKVIYGHFINQMMAGRVPFYTQSNIIIDVHVYDGYVGRSSATTGYCAEPKGGIEELNSLVSRVAFAHAHHADYIINEWGGCYDLPDYNTAIINFVLQNHTAGLGYFEWGNWFRHGHQPNENAQLAEQAYSTIFGSQGVTEVPRPQEQVEPGSVALANRSGRSLTQRKLKRLLEA